MRSQENGCDHREDSEKLPGWLDSRKVRKEATYDHLYTEKKIGLSLAPSRRMTDHPEWYRDRDELAIIVSITKRGSKLLDVGCGAGRLAIPLANSGVSVIGIDVSSSGVRLAHQYDQSRLGEYIVADMYNLPFKEAIFDSAIVSGTFEYVKNLSPPMLQIARVIKQAGTIYFHIWNLHGLKLRRILKLKTDRGAQEFELSDLRRQIEQSHLKLKRAGGLLFLLPSDVRLACRTLRLFRLNEWWAAQVLYRVNHIVSSSSVGFRVCPVIWAVVEQQLK